MKILTVLVVLWLKLPVIISKMNELLSEPLIREDGDFTIVGIFDIGKL